MSVSTRHQVTRLAMQIGLVTTRPPRGRRRALQVRARRTARLLAAPGPFYISTSLLGSLMVAFLVGLWLL